MRKRFSPSWSALAKSATLMARFRLTLTRRTHNRRASHQREYEAFVLKTSSQPTSTTVSAAWRSEDRSLMFAILRSCLPHRQQGIHTDAHRIHTHSQQSRIAGYLGDESCGTHRSNPVPCFPQYDSGSEPSPYFFFAVLNPALTRVVKPGFSGLMS